MRAMQTMRILVVIAAALCGLCSSVRAPVAAETIQTGMISAPNAAGWPWYIGIEKGLFAAAGINLNLIYAPTASGLVQQLAAGSLAIVGDAGVVEPIHAVERGAPVALLRIVGRVSPYEMLAKPDIPSIKDLKGKTICIGGLLDISRVYLDRVMKANGLADGDYDTTIIGNTAGRFAALKSGAADATMLAPPINFFAEEAGFRSVGMIVDYAGDLPFSAAVVSLTYATRHKETVTKVLAALDKSVAWFNDPVNRSEAVDVLAREMKSPREPLERSYDYLRKIDYFARNNDVSRSRTQSLINAMKEIGDIKRGITPERVVMPGLTHLVD
jgi:NitT/TauT family transport system substrate-binding protein